MRIPRVTVLGNCLKTHQLVASLYFMSKTKNMSGSFSYLFLGIYSLLFRGVLGKSQRVLGHKIQSGLVGEKGHAFKPEANFHILILGLKFDKY